MRLPSLWEVIESFKGKNGKSINLYGNGNTKRVSIFGLGKKEKLNSDSLKQILGFILDWEAHRDQLEYVEFLAPDGLYSLEISWMLKLLQI